ncbi:hypothetical protein RMCBS344292_16986 [Rhizopus microsporus]|nr:hypothetical protein RMCBS344292_16986 [Rhizopus microsporus]
MRKAKKEEPEEYEVEKIVNHRVAGRVKKRIEYFIKWKGYSSKDNTWEPSSAVTNAEELVKQYWDTHGGLEERDKLLGKKRPVTTKKKTTPLKRQRQDSPEATIKRKKTADTASDHEQNTQKNKEEEEEKIESASETHSPLMKPEETEVEEVKEQIPKETKPEKQDVEASETKQVASAEEEDLDDYEEDDIITDPDYRRDWDWTKDIDSLIKVQRGRKRELEALIRWKDGVLALYTTASIKKKCPKLLLDYYESRLQFQKKSQINTI